MHISYVRSVNMDEWKPKELKKMQLGGNSKMNSFLKKSSMESLHKYINQTICRAAINANCTFKYCPVNGATPNGT